MGNERHGEHSDNQGPLHKGQVISPAIHESVQPRIKPMAFQGGATKIEGIMRSNLIEFAAQVEHYKSPTSVLDALDDAIAEDVSLMVLGAKRFGVNLRDRESLKVGDNVFIHKSVPEGWWDAYFELSKKAYAPMIMMARHCLAPYTWTECLRIFELWVLIAGPTSWGSSTECVMV